jgi:hypothetical protein
MTGWRAAVHAGVAALVLAAAAPAPAQTRVGRSDATGVETDPIRCWWKTDRSSVVVGERVILTLTCAVVETGSVKVVPDMNQLEPTVVPLSPFEVVRAVRHDDIQAPPWRYFQYEYTVRLVGDAFFGKDVDVPPLKVTYRIRSAIGGGTEGRDQTYVLPALPMRIASLVPRSASDIRDASGNTFADIEARRARATRATVAAAILFAFAAVLAGVAGTRLVGRYRTRAPAATRPIPARAVVRGCVEAMSQARSAAAGGGWTPVLVGRALAALRVAGAIALERPVAQVHMDAGAAEREGQLQIRSGLFGRRRALVSTPVTPATIAKVLAAGGAAPPRAQAQAVLARVQDALRLFGAARYGRNGEVDAALLDTALDDVAGSLRRLRAASLWPARGARKATKSAAEAEGVAWSR